MTVADRLLDLVARETRAERLSLSLATRFDDLGADSLDLVQVYIEVEDEFGVVVPDGDAAAFKTLGDLAAFIDAAAKNPPPTVEEQVAAGLPEPANAPEPSPPPPPDPAWPGHPLRGLLAGQFLGAFNNNAWRLMAALLAVRALKAAGVPAGPALETASQAHTTLAFVLFTLPLLLFSLPAGAVADRFSKRSVLVGMKAVELLLLSIGAALLVFLPTGGWPLLVVLALLGSEVAIFGPAKYGIVPELVPHRQLSAANGRLEMVTFLGIIAGTAACGAFLDLAGPHTWLAALPLVLLSAVGLLSLRTLPPVPPAHPGESPLEAFRGARQALRQDRVLNLAVLGLALFWTVSSLLGQDILVFMKADLAASEFETVLPLAVFGLGVGLGSYLAGRLSGAIVEYGFIPLGAAGLALGLVLLALFAHSIPAAAILSLPPGLASGFLVVPLNALVQWRAPPARRGSVLALANLLIYAGILAGSLGALGLTAAGLSARAILAAAALATLAATAWALWLLPEALLRLLMVLFTRTVYRLRVLGREHVPPTGGALLVPNHVTFVDGLFLVASLDRPVQFIVEEQYFHHPLVGPFLRALGAIPISATADPRAILRSLKDAGQYLDDGCLVCIFPEGQLTRNGVMGPFKKGMERLARGRHAPIIPVYLDNVWGSIFSRSGGRFFTKLPERIPYPVTVAFGPPLPSDTPAHEVRRAVHELAADAWMARQPDTQPLHRAAIRQLRRHPVRLMLADATRPRLGGLMTLAAAVALARALRSSWQGQDRVGILLPPSIAGVLANLAAALAGRTSVNLNFTAGPAGMASAARQAGLKTVLTSRTFLDRAGVPLPDGVSPIFLEDLGPSLSRPARAWSMLLAALAPVRLLERACGAARPVAVDDVATVIFSSGSTGEPKGVELSHFNLASNVAAVLQIFPHRPTDRLLGILPLFHSFGCMSLWLALSSGIAIVCHPSPLDAAAIGALVARYRLTMMLTTPTFLQLYLRRCSPAQFGSLRIVLTGAERLPETLVRAFEDQFGIRPLEGYGTTECSPVVAASTLDFRAPGFYQPGSRRGTVGQPLPGVAIRVVDLETSQVAPPGTPGMLLVRGPNVMKGYLGRPDLTAKVLRDGWYSTGDVALLDEDGFLMITDRLSRFSKLGGEMVPHGTVEDALQKAWGKPEPAFAVTAVPDERKGERLAVVHTLDDAQIPAILEKVAASGLPNLFLPRRDAFVRVDRLPLLGTGKLDLKAVKETALAALAAGS